MSNAIITHVLHFSPPPLFTSQIASPPPSWWLIIRSKKIKARNCEGALFVSLYSEFAWNSLKLSRSAEQNFVLFHFCPPRIAKKIRYRFLVILVVVNRVLQNLSLSHHLHSFIYSRSDNNSKKLSWATGDNIHSFLSRSETALSQVDSTVNIEFPFQHQERQTLELDYGS